MLDAFLWPQSLPFSVALAVLAGIAAIELVSVVIGASIGALLENFFDLDGLDGDMGAFSRALSWLRIGKVPFLIGLIVALTLYGLAGLLAQVMVAAIVGTPLPAWIMGPAVLLAVAPTVRWVNGGLGRIMPKDETQVVSSDSFKGRSAVVVLGSVTHTNPGQVRLKDQYGQNHYLMAQADLEDDRFETGTKVLLVEASSGGRWTVIAAHDDA